MIKLVIGGIITFLVLIFILSTFQSVEQTERGVLTKFGEVKDILEPGLHTVNPFTSDVHKVDVSVKALAVSELAYSKDSQVVTVAAVVNYQIDPSRVRELWEEVRNDAEVRYVLPRTQEALKETIAAYTAQGIIDNRAKLGSELKTKVVERLQGEGILVQDVSLTNFDFDDQYEAAVQNKQVQEQQALAQANITKQEEEKKKQEILRAEALAEKTRLEVEALASAQSEKIIEKIIAEAQLEAARRWDGKLPVNMYGSAPVPLIHLGQ
jgi:regulator of protease activity HflC (stomatin/prohibitin superfamily)